MLVILWLTILVLLFEFLEALFYQVMIELSVLVFRVQFERAFVMSEGLFPGADFLFRVRLFFAQAEGGVAQVVGSPNHVADRHVARGEDRARHQGADNSEDKDKRGDINKYLDDDAW